MATKVLAVDDSRTMRDMVNYTLSQAGYEVLEAEDGQKALAVLGRTKVDCVITDLNMPVMDGLQLIRQLRGMPDHRLTPILMLTTETDASKRTPGARRAPPDGW
jgi:two-component system chemotaxis response regulator CheY